MPEDAKTKFLQMVEPSESSLGGDEGAPPAPEEGLNVAAEAAMAAIKAGDSKAFLSAVQDIFDMMEARPHPEAGEPEAA